MLAAVARSEASFRTQRRNLEVAMRRLALLFLIAACGGSSGPGSSNSDAGNPDSGYPSAVTIELGRDTGTSTFVAAGTPVQWHNASGTAHPVEIVGPQSLGSTEVIAAGGTSAPQTLPPGTYRYRSGAVEGSLIVQ
jgi:plastocyanin